MAKLGLDAAIHALATAVDAGEAITPEMGQTLRELLGGVEPPEALRIEFRKPIEFAGSSYTGIDLREPTAAEMLQWDKLGGTEADIRAVAIVSGMPEPAVKQMGGRDLLKAGRYLGAFLA
ncbi:hypothetical protein FHS31_000837 [Sphingomonas vulcanisoli]|uniref:Phage tail assembly protein n=1 Tax=Sphingomonas vulcanisoli TaxID=1658060 RepID=A0ABX0TUI5_9SPHN|nr:phage tail assembly protein [Sphingomonas vulcanisoli]NIJ07241.1 hypothetical protein [Sphingomonas vulcanisoli]